MLKNIEPDAVVGAWEKLALALGLDPKKVSGLTKHEWASRIAPYLDLDAPKSPSFSKLIADLTMFTDLSVSAPLGQEFGAK